MTYAYRKLEGRILTWNASDCARVGTPYSHMDCTSVLRLTSQLEISWLNFELSNIPTIFLTLDTFHVEIFLEKFDFLNIPQFRVSM